MEDNSKERCPICGLNKSSSTEGSITQFISTCKCDLVRFSPPTDLPEIRICAKCSKRVNEGRVGSFTGYIFRSNVCECTEPLILDKADAPKYQSAVFNSYSIDFDEESIQSLEIEEGKFPLDRYIPLVELGAGASGSVYLARDKLLKKRVSIKILHSISSADIIAFQEEAKATSKLNHPNIIRVLDFGATIGNSPYMVLEHLSGVSLDRYLFDYGTLDASLSIEIASQLCNALSYAHENEVFHRDIKPSNIFLTSDDNGELLVKLIDFGVAKTKTKSQEQTIVQGTTIVGTPFYMSPDQMNGYTYDVRSEIYSLGCTLFETLTSRPPFDGQSALEILHKHANEVPPEIKSLTEKGIPAKLESLIYKMIEKEPANRHQSIEELLADLNSIGSTRKTDQPVSKGHKRVRSSIYVLSTFLVGIVLLIAMGTYFSNLQKSMIKSSVIKKVVDKPVEFDFEFNEVNNFVYVTPYVKNGKFTDETFKILAKELTKSQMVLKHRNRIGLDLATFEITGSGFRYLKGLPICGLDLKHSNIESRYCKLFKDFPLIALDLEKTKIESSGFKEIVGIESLRVLSLTSCKLLKDTDFENVSKLRNLRKLKLDNIPITDKALEHISGCKNLRVISMDYTDVTDEGIKSLCQLDCIEILSVNFCKNLTGETLKLICTKFPNQIQSLDLADLNSDSSGLKALNKCTNLQIISFVKTPMVDSDLEFVPKQKKLTYFFISDTDITDKALTYFYDLKNIQTIKIVNCPGVTKSGIDEMRSNIGHKVRVDTTYSFKKSVDPKKIDDMSELFRFE